MISARGLCRSFELAGHRIDALISVDLKVEQGEFLSITGPSGAGKSTLLQILGTLDVPSAGALTIGGEDPFLLDEEVRARLRNEQIGFVFQNHHLLPGFTALENAMLPALLRNIDRKKAMELAEARLAQLGLGSRLRHLPGELSGGEQQRVALARALLLTPKLLLADEPTGNLDGETARGIHDALAEINRESQVTLITITHNERLADMAMRRVRMEAGAIVSDSLRS